MAASEWTPALIMVAVDVVFAVMNTLIKEATERGLDRAVLITLRQLVAALFMAPVAFFHDRKSRPKLTLEICVYLFFSALLGASLTQYLFYFGMENTSAAFACAFLNLAPAFTFLISLPLRLESLDWKTKPGLAKALGAVLCFIGVAVLTFYQGPALQLSHAFRRPPSGRPERESHSSSGKWLRGSAALLGGSFCWSSWFPLQAKVGKKYPAIYTSTALIFFLGFLQAAAVSLATSRGRFSAWLLDDKLEIGTVFFAGALGSGVGFLAMSWCVEQRGPVFTAAFTPLVQIIVAAIDFLFLHQQIFLGSVLGSILVILGLYSLLWAKRKEAHLPQPKPKRLAEAHEESQQAQPQV